VARNYLKHATAFAQWLDRLEASKVAVANPVAVIRWNMDKRYLHELLLAGFPVLPTEFVPRGDHTADLKEVLAARGWTHAVVKPVISNGSHETFRVLATEADDKAVQARFGRIVEGTGALVQEYVKEIEAEGAGEYGFVFMGGSFSHAVRKSPAKGDFRVQTSYGGTTLPFEAPAELLEHAKRLYGDILEAVKPKGAQQLLYARIDGVCVDPAQPIASFQVMEVELFEPSLYMLLDPASPQRFASCIHSFLLSV